MDLDFQMSGGNASIYGSKPIADLFLETTVLFADIAGFTAWSSAREPSSVFRLLEHIYGKPPMRLQAYLIYRKLLTRYTLHR